ncbi:MAG: ATP-binding cassette domain-containing protein [Pseudomonadota bacterium]
MTGAVPSAAPERVEPQARPAFAAPQADPAPLALSGSAAYRASGRAARQEEAEWAASPYEQALPLALDALDWRGEARALLEAAPHNAPIVDAAGFQATLERLGLGVEAADLSLRRGCAGEFPVLYETRRGLRLALGRRVDGRLDAVLIEAGAEPAPRAVAPPRGTARRLILSPAPSLSASGEGAPRAGASWLSGFLATLRDPIIGLLCLTFALNLLALATPLYAMAAYNLVIPSRAIDTLFFATLMLGAALLAEDALRRLRGRLTASLAERLHHGVVGAAFSALIAAPLSRLEAAPQGAQLARLRRFEGLSAPLGGPLGAALLDAPFALIFIAVIAALAGPLALIPIALGAALALAAALCAGGARRAEAERAAARREAQDLARETARLRRDLRAAGAEGAWLARLDRAFAAEADWSGRRDAAEQIAGHAAQSAVVVAAAAMLAFGALAVIASDLTIGALIAVIMLMWKALSPFQTLFAALPRLRAGREDAAMLDQLMRSPQERAAPPRAALRSPSAFVSPAPSLASDAELGALAFDGVSYRPPGARDFALRGVSFALAPGERLGIMGAGGAGRSTLLRLSLGLAEPTLGAVAAGGAPLAQHRLAAHRSACAFAPETPALPDEPLCELFRVLRHDLTEAEIEMALDALETPLDPALFPGGLATRLTPARQERLGVSLLQRISIARALLAGRRYLLLDEPTAQLDAPARAALLGQLAARRGPTTLIASNDADALRLCDKVLALAQGRAAAFGPPEAVFGALGSDAGEGGGG